MPSHKRLFFACWPDEKLKKEIASITSDIIIPNGRRINADNLHLTLAFLGDVDRALGDKYGQAAKSVKAKAFSLGLQGYGHFQRPRVFYMGVDNIPAELHALYNNLNSQLVPHGYQLEQRAYTPHVSLFRKADQFPENLPKIRLDWYIDRFYLAESTYGPGHAIYSILEEYKL